MIASTLGGGSGERGWSDDQGGTLVAFDPTQVTSRANRSNPQPGDPCRPLAASAHVPAIAHTLRAGGFDAGEDGTGRGTPLVAFSTKDHGADAGDMAPTLRAMGHSGSHANGGGQVGVAGFSGVRRLTPRECERLMGWPDDHTRWRVLPDGRTVEQADGPRYMQCGNGVVANVAEWIARRLVEAS